jgi:carboxyl-terminal processing protease
MRRLPLVLLGAVAGAGLAFFGSQSGPLPGAARAATDTDASSRTYRELQLFGKIFDVVRAGYVENPDSQKMIEAAISGMVSALDPHSSYMDTNAFREMQVETSGQFGGLGIEVTQENGLIKVVAPIDNTPAARAGIQANDVITRLDGQPVKDMSLQDAVKKMRGTPASTIRLEIMRKGLAQPLDLELKREIIKVHAVQSRDEGGDVGYLRITQFNDHASNELAQAIGTLSARIPADKLKGYILDLRNDPGGLLDEAVGVSNTFLNRGEIVSIRGRDADDTQRFDAKATPGDLTKGKPLIVLINGGSASASEIVAGALQDLKRATIAGTRSFGKGSVQTIIPLGPGAGALRLTTARYFTPSGRSIQAMGISPDIEVRQDVPSDKTATDETVSEAGLRGHLTAQGQEQKGSQSYIPPDPKDDKALHLALDLLRGTKTDPAFPPQANIAFHK